MLSIIIPVLNEAATIKTLLTFLSENISGENEIEILVVDGESYDGTPKIISAFSENSRITVKLIASEKGRAKQMNKGTKEASGKIFYFLHADSFPPKDFDKYIVSEVDKGNPAGCFRMKFDSTHWWLQLAGWLTQFRWRACRGGDQSQFITKQLFEKIGGFDENYSIYEDNVLIDQLYASNKFVVIQKWLTTSARCYEQNGVWKLQYHFWAIYVKRWLGADADELYDYYSKNIKQTHTSKFPEQKTSPQIFEK